MEKNTVILGVSRYDSYNKLEGEFRELEKKFKEGEILVTESGIGLHGWNRTYYLPKNEASKKIRDYKKVWGEDRVKEIRRLEKQLKEQKASHTAEIKRMGDIGFWGFLALKFGKHTSKTSEL